jgi:hypothetical protein
MRDCYPDEKITVDDSSHALTVKLEIFQPLRAEINSFFRNYFNSLIDPPFLYMCIGEFRHVGNLYTEKIIPPLIS